MNALGKCVEAVQWEITQEDDCEILDVIDFPGNIRYVPFKKGDKDFGLYFLLESIDKDDFPYHLIALKKQVSMSAVKRYAKDIQSNVFVEKLTEQRIAVFHNLALEELMIKIREF